MFGTNDDNQQSNDDPAMLDNVKQLVNDPAYPVSPPQNPTQFMTNSTQPQPAQQPVPSMPVPDDQTQTPIAEPAQGFSSSPMPEPPVSVEPPVSAEPSAYEEPQAEQEPLTQTSGIEPIDADHLAGMKQQALDHLAPLIGHLDQSPEESFKTTMMMIQANDNHNLLEKALDEAKLIVDDKERANAMLDIINEINYFSQSQ